MKVLFLLSLVTLTCALSEHTINKRVLPINTNCDPNSGTCRKGDWVAQHIAACKQPKKYWLNCGAKGKLVSWIVDVAVDDTCKPVSGKRFKCGEEGTNTRCVCSDTNKFHTPFKFNSCQCQYWPLEDVGAHSPAFCTAYYMGGTFRLHHWACCNNCNDSDPGSCNVAKTWQGGSRISYCGSCGTNTGSGRVEYYFNCGSCSTQKDCSDYCWWYNFAGAC